MSSQIDDLLKQIGAATKAHKVSELIALSGELQELMKRNHQDHQNQYGVVLLYRNIHPENGVCPFLLQFLF